LISREMTRERRHINIVTSREIRRTPGHLERTCKTLRTMCEKNNVIHKRQAKAREKQEIKKKRRTNAL